MNSPPVDIWQILNIARTEDAREIKRAYARQLKLSRPDDDPVAFQRLRDAYDQALQMAARGQEAVSTPAAKTSVAPAADAASASGLAEKNPVSRTKQDDSRPSTATDEIGFAVADPQKEAAILWQEWLNAAGGMHLKTLDARQAMANFSVREAFEHLALRYSASAACSDQTRATLMTHFDWSDRIKQLHQIDAQATKEMLGRHNAACALSHLHESGRFNTALALLMSPPPASSRRLNNADFTHRMLELIQIIQRHHPDLLAYKINADAFIWWEQQARAKKYFTDTAVYSGLAGIALYAICVLAYHLGEFRFTFPHFAVLLMGQAISFALGAVLTFHRPTALLERLAQIRQARFGTWLAHGRYQKKWQFGWLWLYAASSLLLFVPRPATLTVFTASIALCACAVLAILSASVQLKPAAYAVLLPLSLLLAYFMKNLGFEDFHFTARLAFSLCLLLMLARGGPQLYAATAWPEQRRANLRTVWLVSGTAIFFISATTLLPSSVALITAWLWCLAALPLYEFKIAGIPKYLIWPALLLGKFAIVAAAVFFKELPDARLVIPELLLLCLAILLVGNLYRAAQEKNIYS